MEKKTIVVLFGGCSSEYSVSLQSSFAVLSNLDQEAYQIIPIGITERGAWFCYRGDFDRIPADTWKNDIQNLTPAAASPNPNVHGIIEWTESGIKTTAVDCVFPVLHGKNGEDGTVQGMFELAGIPIAGCGTLASALCMDKDRAHKLASLAGVTVPKSMVLEGYDDRQTAAVFARNTGYPLFVKPVKAGSSHGITKVQKAEELMQAVELAFQYDDQVIIEEAIEGFEVGCAVMGTDQLMIGEVDEIELSGGFFDFTEKYTLKTSAIHVPARIDRRTAERVKQTAQVIYRTLGCSGFARVDMFLTPDGRIVFNEVNTIPGFTEHSRFPGMMKAAGISFKEILDTVIGEAVRK